MPKILLELNEEEDRFVEVYKIMKNLQTKQDAIKEMIHYFDVEIKPKKMSEREYFKVKGGV